MIIIILFLTIKNRIINKIKDLLENILLPENNSFIWIDFSLAEWWILVNLATNSWIKFLKESWFLKRPESKSAELFNVSSILDKVKVAHWFNNLGINLFCGSTSKGL